MRKLILFNMVTLDGLFEGSNHDLSWHRTDEEFNEFAIEQLNTAGALIFGRVTYEMMAEFWPSTYAIETDPIVANLMNSMPKIAVSRTLKKTDWNNTRLVTGDIGDEIRRLKEAEGGDLYVFGSANLAGSLSESGLIDEYRLIVNPVILRSGSPLFKPGEKNQNLALSWTRVFGNGNVLLVYRRVDKEE